ncbi:cytochrome P450 4c3-like [Diorhabda carinulata]|uniref:cytochrome P450 4c3-like n=1 Tax=Diorhabda carinulata TaxID=1163345 RepID=UPI0025A0656E|nr:cytochrome P450 4c3-like [Diorhabda carinulata]
MLFPLIVLVILLAFLFLMISHKKLVKQQKKNFKNFLGPPPNPIFGNMLYFIRPTYEYLDLFQKFTDTYGSTFLAFDGPLNCLLVTSDAKLFEIILGSTKVVDKIYIYDNLLNWLGTGLLTSGGSKWRSRRRMLTPAFHFSILDDFVNVFETVGDNFIKKLEEHIGEETFDIYPLTSLYTLDIICEATMGIKVNALMDGDSEYVKNVKKICKLITAKNFSGLPKILQMFTLTHYKEMITLKKLHSHTDAVIKNRRIQLNEAENRLEDSAVKRKYAFLDLLINSTIDGQPLSDQDIREEVDTFMFEGHDTTSAAISFALYCLANNPIAQVKAFEEQRQIFGDFKNVEVTMKHLQNMKYLELVIKETLRLYPSVPLLGRMAPEDIKWDNIIIPRGYPILLIPFITHRDPKWFRNPLEFIPERFSKDDCTNPYKYIPFSAGSRNCIGQKFAMLELKSTISKVLRNFELLPAKDNIPLLLSPELTLVPSNGVRLSLKKRSLSLIMLLLLIVLVLSSALLFLIVSHKQLVKEKKKNFKKFLGPQPNPILGNMLDFARPSYEYLDIFRKYTDKYGSTFLIFDGPLTCLLVTSDAKLFEIILSSTKVVDKIYIYDNLLNWLGTGLLTSGGAKWKSRRRMLTPAFHFSILEDFVNVFETVGDAFIKKLDEHVGQETFNIYPLTSLCTLDIICEATMGIKVNALIDGDSEYVKNVKKICKLITAKNFSGLPKILHMFTLTHYKEMITMKKLHSHTDAVIKNRRIQLNEHGNQLETSTTKKKCTFLDLLINSTIDGQPLNDQDIREEVDTFMFEGHDTTSWAISLVLFCLANNPIAQAKAFDEQRKIIDNFENVNITMKHLQNMKYLELVIKETLRLYPSVPLLGRMAPSDIEWEGNIIPKGQPILLVPFLTHRDPKWFRNPLEFIPERFSEDDYTTPYKYIPFSAGSRNCIGQKFAMLEMKSTISKVLRNFELLPAKDNTPLLLSPELTLVSSNGVRVSLKKRC